MDIKDFVFEEPSKWIIRQNGSFYLIEKNRHIKLAPLDYKIDWVNINGILYLNKSIKDCDNCIIDTE